MNKFEAWFATHKDSCTKNYEESSKKMEQVAAEILWKWSVSLLLL